MPIAFTPMNIGAAADQWMMTTTPAQPWLTINTANGQITGTPSSTGSFNATVTATRTLNNSSSVLNIQFNIIQTNKMLCYATYYGGFGADVSSGVATDILGNVYITGRTNTNTPGVIASGGYKNALQGSDDAFLVKFNSTGTREWGTYFGGAGIDDALAIAIINPGDIYITGTTQSATGVALVGHQMSQCDTVIKKFHRLWFTRRLRHLLCFLSAGVTFRESNRLFDCGFECVPMGCRYRAQGADESFRLYFHLERETRFLLRQQGRGR
jgi:hypothetical protein